VITLLLVNLVAALSVKTSGGLEQRFVAVQIFRIQGLVCLMLIWIEVRAGPFIKAKEKQERADVRALFRLGRGFGHY
jgi:hypothetical protein